MKNIACVFLGFYLLNSLLYAQSDLQKRRPDFGVIWNDDGDLAFMDPDPDAAEQLLRTSVKYHTTLGINTFVYCVGQGSEVLLYPSKAGSPVGWRTSNEEKKDRSWQERIQIVRNALAAGKDAVKIAGEEAKKNGMRFIPSLRMNDSHFVFDPLNYPLTGEFWMKNKDKYLIGDSPMLFEKAYGNLLDYTHEEVRNYRLNVVKEVIERNISIIDGFELDFNRNQVFFPRDKGVERGHFITDLVRKVRAMLDEAEKQQGRPMSLFVRIPPALETCKWAGLEVEKWMEEGLVDLVSPAQLMTLAHDMPIHAMIEKGKKHGVLVYPSLYERTSWRAALDFEKPDLGMNDVVGREATNAELLGAAANYRNMGASGFYLFNFDLLSSPNTSRINMLCYLVGALKHNRLDPTQKVFAVTKTYYHDNVKPSYAYVKQLPALVDNSQDFAMEVGELPGDSPFPLKGCVLRVGTKATGAPVVSLNGKELVLWKTFAEGGKGAKGKKKNRKGGRDIASHTHIYGINDTAILKRGTNTITIKGGKLPLVDLEIGYAYLQPHLTLGKRSSKPLSFKTENPSDSSTQPADTGDETE